jgi:hypothetical protein
MSIRNVLIVMLIFGNLSVFADVSSDLLGFWKFDEESGTVAADSSGLGNAGRVGGNPVWTSGRFGNAINLTNNGGYVSLDEKSMFNISTKTITFWVKIQAHKNYNIVYADKRGDYIGFDSYGYVRASWRTASNTSMSLYYNSTNTLGIWAFYAFVFDVNGTGVNVSCYKNGLIQYFKFYNTGLTISPVICLAARSSSGDHYLNGAVDDVRIYARALTAADILDVFNGAQPNSDLQAPTVCSNLVATKVIANEVDLFWAPARDNIYVMGYRIYRNGIPVSTSPSNFFADLSVTQTSTYTYTVAAYDGMGNQSSQSSPVTVTTPAKPANWPTAIFNIEPGSTVEVGEAVFFDGSWSLDDQSFTNIVGTYPAEKTTDFDWDFGDGYKFKRSVGEMDNGPVFLHYFMQPGTYPVTLTVTDTDGNKDSMVKPITVYGTTPMAGFELWHAPIHARIAQYVYTQIPVDLRSYRLVVTLTNDSGYSATLLDKTGLLSEEKFLLNHRILPVGNFVIQADILNGTARVTRVREKFSKTFSGIPHIGIDENNAIRINDQPFFPVTPWLLGKTDIKQWSRYCNTLFGQGYVNGTKTTNSWKLYLDEALANKMYACGPEFWDGRGPSHFFRQSDIARLRDYVRVSKDHPANLGYSWNDEPNLGGRGLRNPAQVLSAWNFVTAKEDPHHPTQVNLYGADFSIYNGDPNPAIIPYAFLYNGSSFGGKRHCIGDIIGLDEYVLEYCDHLSMNQGVLAADGLVANWVKLLENMKKWNHNLTPFTQFIENQDVANAATVSVGKNIPGPTPDEVRMQFWLSIVHGCHMINYFNMRLDRNPANQGVLEENLRLVTQFADVILGPESSVIVTDDADVRGRQVDTLIRETTNEIFIFAIRLTEPDFSQLNDGLQPEDETVNVTFTVNGCGSDSIVDEFYVNESLCEYRSVSTSTNSFSLTLAQPPLRGTVALSSVFEIKNVYYGTNLSIPDPNWNYAYDLADGSLSGDVYGLPNTGLVNYANRTVSVKFGKNALVGTNYLAATYTPLRSRRRLAMNNGVFSDTFKLCGLHIYRIPKVGSPPSPLPAPPAKLKAVSFP